MTATIDLRSDVFATPTDAMWGAMRSAEVGWAYFGQDPSVNRLEALAATAVGKQAALFVPTCSMANLVALMTLAEPGSRLILETTSHIATTEAAGVARICGLVPHPIDGRAGALAPDDVETALTRGGESSGTRPAVVCLENTHNNAGGAPLTPEQTGEPAEVARRHGARVHLDGARLFNAAVALGMPADRLAASADTVAFSLNKGLGAPFGAILAGPAAVIDAARANLHQLGAASIHQAGILAAPGIVALTTMVDRLADDHRRAAELARRLARIPSLIVDPASVRTNIVIVDVSPTGLSAEQFAARLAERQVLGYPRPASKVRFVTHRLIGDADIERAAEAVAAAATA